MLRTRTIESSSGSGLSCRLRRRSSLASLAPVGQRMNTLRRCGGSCNSALHPGRVARHSTDRGASGPARAAARRTRRRADCGSANPGLPAWPARPIDPPGVCDRVLERIGGHRGRTPTAPVLGRTRRLLAAKRPTGRRRRRGSSCRDGAPPCLRRARGPRRSPPRRRCARCRARHRPARSRAVLR